MYERWVTARVNRMVYIISIFIGLALSAGYLFDYLDSEVPAAFFYAFVGVVAAQLVCNTIIYITDKGSPKFKYAALIGYTAVYFIAMFGRIDALYGLNEDTIAFYIYVIFVPFMMLYIGYFDLKLIKIMSLIAIIFNIAKVAFHIYIGNTTGDDFAEYMVQIGCIATTVAGVYAVTKISHENHMKRLSEIENSVHLAEQSKNQAEAVNKMMLESINYASKIQKNLLPQEKDMQEVFSDYSVIWKPRDIVGGDVYWMKQFSAGTVLCIADCTGHGTPGALLTTLVTSALESIVWEGNCDDTADILWQLDQRLAAVLHVDSEEESSPGGIMDIDDGCDIVSVFVAKDRSVRFSSGNIPVFVCNGTEVKQHKGQKLFIGEGKLKNRSDVEAVSIPANPDNKYYIASDGLFDQIGGERGIQYGYEQFKHVILENHKEKQSVITARVWDAYRQYRGAEAQRDDFELISFMP